MHTVGAQMSAAMAEPFSALPCDRARSDQKTSNRLICRVKKIHGKRHVYPGDRLLAPFYGPALKALRQTMGYTQEAFAAASGIGSRAFVNRLSAVRRSLLLTAMEITSPQILCYDENEE